MNVTLKLLTDRASCRVFKNKRVPAADALGLGSVYIGPVFDSMAQIRRMCRLPQGVVPVVSLAVGYPRIKPPRRKKLPAALLAHSEVYREPSDKELLAAFRKRYEGVKEAVNKKDLKVLDAACRAAHNAGFAEKSLKDVKARGNFNAPQIVFGLHYRADRMLRNTPKQLRMLKAAGLAWAG